MVITTPISVLRERALDSFTPLAEGGRRSLLLALSLALFLLWDAGGALVRELARVPPNRFFELHEAEFRSPADAGRTLAKATALYDGMAQSARGPLELRRLAWLRLIARERQADAGPGQGAVGPDDLADLLRASLRREPVHPLSWAYEAAAVSADPAAACRFLGQSYRVAPVEPDFFLYRFALALQCHASWDVSLFRAVTREIRALFPESGSNPATRAFVRAVESDPRLVSFVTRVLAADQGALQRFQDALRKKRVRISFLQ